VNAHEVRRWISNHNATVSVGEVLTPLGEKPAVICTANDRILYLRVMGSTVAPAAFTQDWNWEEGYWSTKHIGEVDDVRAANVEQLHALIVGECPRCHGAGVIEAQTRYGAFMVPDLLPCPECQRQESEPPLPF
jgi:hypothetical protein